MKLLRLAATMLLAVLATTVGVSSASADKPVKVRDAAVVAKSWTAERRAHAQPMEVVRAGAAVPAAAAALPGASKGASWPDASTDPVERSVVKVFFTLGGVDYVCSGSTVMPAAGSTKSVVLTAGHCTWDDVSGYATDFTVIPNYDAFTGSCTLDSTCWVAESLNASAGWRKLGGDDFHHDFAFATFNGTLAAAVGSSALVPIGLGIAPPTAVYAFGYPAASPYQGHDLTYCAGATVRGSGTGTVGLKCNMTGGSSGGPWYTLVNGVRSVVSLNSFGLIFQPGKMFGPVFDSQATAALTAAS